MNIQFFCHGHVDCKYQKFPIKWTVNEVIGFQKSRLSLQISKKCNLQPISQHHPFLSCHGIKKRKFQGMLMASHDKNAFLEMAFYLGEKLIGWNRYWIVCIGTHIHRIWNQRVENKNGYCLMHENFLKLFTLIYYQCCNMF